MTRPTLIAVFGLVVALVAALLAFDHEREEPPAPPSASGTVAPPAPIADLRRPSFDVVRIGGEGDAVLAGRAQPGAQVIILDGAAELGRVAADARGEWVFVPPVAFPPGGRELRLRSLGPDGEVLDSGEPVVLVVPDKGQGGAIALKSMPTGGTALMQGPSGPDQGPVSLDLIDHDDNGRLFLSGKATAGRAVQVYLDDRLFGRADADAEGTWRLSGPRPAGDSHRVRVDLLMDSSGRVAARIEADWAPGASVVPAGPGEVVIAPGASLWRIARRIYGEGTAYTVIFAANRDRIRDPNLIYPGQVFSLPPR